MRKLHAVYDIMRDDCALIDPIWWIVDSYATLFVRDMVMYTLATRDFPETHAGLYDVVEELDEYIWLRYDPISGRDWQNLSVIDRILDMKHTIFRCEYVHEFHDIRDMTEYNSTSIVDWVIQLINECNHGGGRTRGTHELKCKFARTMFDKLDLHGCKKLNRGTRNISLIRD